MCVSIITTISPPFQTALRCNNDFMLSFRDEDVWAEEVEHVAYSTTSAAATSSRTKSMTPNNENMTQSGVSSGGSKPRGRPTRPFLFSSTRTPGAPLARRSPLKVLNSTSARINGGPHPRSPFRMKVTTPPLKLTAVCDTSPIWQSPNHDHNVDSVLEHTTDKLTTSFLLFGQHGGAASPSPVKPSMTLTPPNSNKANGLCHKAVRIKLTENKGGHCVIGSSVKTHLLSPSPVTSSTRIQRVQLSKFIRSPSAAILSPSQTPSKQRLRYADDIIPDVADVTTGKVPHSMVLPSDEQEEDDIDMRQDKGYVPYSSRHHNYQQPEHINRTNSTDDDNDSENNAVQPSLLGGGSGTTGARASAGESKEQHEEIRFSCPELTPAGNVSL